ncbi:MAG: hypothetical protein O7C59_04025 [Rickettsia endosymbiont of Ixodes persulcatus]|nr:hypothetical protein [Rickettsia endosymbiont of Ixodes persulcatus]MCZ6903357.1 hypothetical protein [Rickettsia endosymbiont of Ixodes persulcatus]MCZ6908432.1 hypothetical protein [Rickettsia endosymbiont of Ixodes persulcatus]MCZ6909812.1 hypothetical protein [Rickettsia endosymbiont of Ixodes persulcatus]MCZ6913720.1 hypothetical protein [Rickettsia endosymbiont of Ixodes persulcatus]
MYVNEPYQYLIATLNGRTNVSGMDIELIESGWVQNFILTYI